LITSVGRLPMEAQYGRATSTVDGVVRVTARDGAVVRLGNLEFGWEI
jgi:hypothetical protein